MLAHSPEKKAYDVLEEPLPGYISVISPKVISFAPSGQRNPRVISSFVGGIPATILSLMWNTRTDERTGGGGRD